MNNWDVVFNKQLLHPNGYTDRVAVLQKEGKEEYIVFINDESQSLVFTSWNDVDDFLVNVCDYKGVHD